MTPDGVFSSLYSFTALPKRGTNQDGAYPGASLVQASDNNLYGTATAGGTNGSGTLFKISLGGSFQLVYTFSALDAYGENSEGSDPEAALIQGTNGILYGTAYAGGSNGFGTVFAYSVAQSQMTSLHSLQKSIDGANPMAALVQGKDGGFYGTTSQGVSETNGTLFKITSTGGFALLHTFTGGTDGANPVAPLVQGTSGNFYGTCANSESGFGTVFEATTNGTVSPLYAFTGGNDGANPAAALLEAYGGVFFGTASSGGSNNVGAIFSITSAGAFTPVMSFVGGRDGSNPEAPLVQGPNGNFYGTTYQGGAAGDGVVFEVTTNGTFTTLYSFTNGLDGGFPASCLTLGTDGNFYGESFAGGAGHSGVTFKVAPEGTVTVLHTFTGEADGSGPVGGLVQGTNGIFYGTTYNDGYEFGQPEYIVGTVFEMGTEGIAAPLYKFTNGYDGGNPRGGLALGTDGNLYGTATSGGSPFGTGLPLHPPTNAGTIFKVTPDGVLTPLHAFTNNLDGELPVCKLVQWTGGNFYGTAPKGGAHGYGTVFMMTPAGSFTRLYSFTNGIDGAAPNAGLVEGPAGYLFGTAASGGAYGMGTIFEINSNGGFTALYSFTGTNNGSSPVAPLVLGSDGNLYGTTSFGGVAGCGTAFKLVLTLLTAPSFTSIVSGPTLTTIAWNTVPGQMYQLQVAAELKESAWANLGAPTNGGNGVASLADTNSGHTQRFYRVNTY